MLPVTPQSRVVQACLGSQRISWRGRDRTFDLRLIRTPILPLSYAPAVGSAGFEPTPVGLKDRYAAVTPRPIRWLACIGLSRMTVDIVMLRLVRVVLQRTGR